MQGTAPKKGQGFSLAGWLSSLTPRRGEGQPRDVETPPSPTTPRARDTLIPDDGSSPHHDGGVWDTSHEDFEDVWSGTSASLQEKKRVQVLSPRRNQRRSSQAESERMSAEQLREVVIGGETPEEKEKLVKVTTGDGRTLWLPLSALKLEQRGPEKEESSEGIRSSRTYKMQDLLEQGTQKSSIRKKAKGKEEGLSGSDYDKIVADFKRDLRAAPQNAQFLVQKYLKKLRPSDLRECLKRLNQEVWSQTKERAKGSLLSRPAEQEDKKSPLGLIPDESPPKTGGRIKHLTRERSESSPTFPPALTSPKHKPSLPVPSLRTSGADLALKKASHKHTQPNLMRSGSNVNVRELLVPRKGHHRNRSVGQVFRGDAIALSTRSIVPTDAMPRVQSTEDLTLIPRGDSGSFELQTGDNMTQIAIALTRMQYKQEASKAEIKRLNQRIQNLQEEYRILNEAHKTIEEAFNQVYANLNRLFGKLIEKGGGPPSAFSNGWVWAYRMSAIFAGAANTIVMLFGAIAQSMAPAVEECVEDVASSASASPLNPFYLFVVNSYILLWLGIVFGLVGFFVGWLWIDIPRERGKSALFNEVDEEVKKADDANILQSAKHLMVATDKITSSNFVIGN